MAFCTQERLSKQESILEERQISLVWAKTRKRTTKNLNIN